MTNSPWKFAALVLALTIVPTVVRAQAMQSVCTDGTKSAAAGKGTCAGHGEVDATATKTFMASGKTVMCTDGTMSAGGRGACSGHGGIGKAGSKKAPSIETKKEERKEEKKEAAKATMEKKDPKAVKKAGKSPA
ncbi:hypothetical protein BH09GEM1_BH09GEM1_40590 [soil metagenome]